MRSGAATTICETRAPPRSWGDFGKFLPLQTSTTVRLSIQFLHQDLPTASLAVWAYVVPPEAMQHVVLLSRDSWMRFSERSYRALPSRPSDNLMLGDLTLSYHNLGGAVAFVADFSAHPAATTSDTREIEESHFRATTNLFKFFWSAVMVPQP